MIGRYRKRSAPHSAGGHVTDFDGRRARSKSVHHHHHEYDHDRSAERAHDGERNEFATVFHYYPRLLCLVESSLGWRGPFATPANPFFGHETGLG
jgi:hypothetical protein